MDVTYTGECVGVAYVLVVDNFYDQKEIVLKMNVSKGFTKIVDVLKKTAKEFTFLRKRNPLKIHFLDILYSMGNSLYVKYDSEI